MALCVIQPRTNTTDPCFLGRAGVEVAYLNSCGNVTELTFDEDRNITAITSPVDVGSGFQRFEFDPDTAFLNQTKTRTANGRGGVNVNVQFSFNIAGITSGDSNILENLNAHKCIHAIVKDNNGKLWYAGVNYYDASGTWSSANMRTGEGSANTGADPTNDLAEFVETLTANQNWYAREYTGTEAAIPVN